MSTSGLGGAPVTKLFFGIALIATILIAGARVHHVVGLSGSFLRQWEVWRVFSMHFVFMSAFEAILGLWMFYAMRIVERLMGSTKFSLFLLLSTILTTAILAAIVLIFPEVTESLPSALSSSTYSNYLSGPYTFIFAAAAVYYLAVPTSGRFSLLGIPLSDKSLVYLALGQLACSRLPQSLIHAVVGFIAGLIVLAPAHDFLGLIKIPKSVESFFSSSFGALLNSSSQPSGPAVRQPMPRTASPARVQRPPVAVPPTVPAGPLNVDDQVASLVAMGFDAVTARQVLTIAGGDIDRALDILSS